MYANRGYGSRDIKPGSLTMAVVINGGMVAAVLLAAPDIVTLKPPGALRVVNIPVETPPLPEPLHPVSKARPASSPTPVRPRPLVVAKNAPVDILPATTPVVSGFDDLGAGTDGGVTVDPPTPAPPVLVEPTLDGRFAGQFQPFYPPEERRIERDGSVVVRVLIGIDGRVRQVERVDATSDAFFNETRRAALARWRFRPGTRNGAPIEQWKTMRVTFRLEEA